MESHDSHSSSMSSQPPPSRKRKLSNSRSSERVDISPDAEEKKARKSKNNKPLQEDHSQRDRKDTGNISSGHGESLAGCFDLFKNLTCSLQCGGTKCSYHEVSDASDSRSPSPEEGPPRRRSPRQSQRKATRKSSKQTE